MLLISTFVILTFIDWTQKTLEKVHANNLNWTKWTQKNQQYHLERKVSANNLENLNCANVNITWMRLDKIEISKQNYNLSEWVREMPMANGTTRNDHFNLVSLHSYMKTSNNIWHKNHSNAIKRDKMMISPFMKRSSSS